jgi:hypothetical protein
VSPRSLSKTKSVVGAPETLSTWTVCSIVRTRRVNVSNQCIKNNTNCNLSKIKWGYKLSPSYLRKRPQWTIESHFRYDLKMFEKTTNRQKKWFLTTPQNITDRKETARTFGRPFSSIALAFMSTMPESNWPSLRASRMSSSKTLTKYSKSLQQQEAAY